jgi:hypothetical protein
MRTKADRRVARPHRSSSISGVNRRKLKSHRPEARQRRSPSVSFRPRSSAWWGLDIRQSPWQCAMFHPTQNTSAKIPQAGAVPTTVPTKLPTLLQWGHRKSLRRGGRVAEGGGLLILPSRFVHTDFHVFCLRYRLLICIETPHLRPTVQQECSNLFAPLGNVATLWVCCISLKLSCAGLC